MKDILNSSTKRKIVIIIAAIALALILTLVIFNLINGNRKSLVCTMTNKKLSGFVINDEIKITMKNDKVYKFDVKKVIEMGKEYSRHNTYHDILENALENAYSYIDKKDYKLTIKDNEFTIKATIKENGVIFDNFQITLNNPDNKYDLKFNPLNNVEASDKAVLIGDEFKITDLEKKVEGYGYLCK